MTDLIERARAKAIELHEHRHAKAGWLMQELADALAAQAETITKLTERCDAYQGQVEAGAAEIERLRAVRRWNIERADGGEVLVCRGEHDKGEKCQYERWTPTARADALAARVAELEAALRQIEGWEPATQEVTLAHQMADLARAALQGAAPAGEGGGS